MDIEDVKKSENLFEKIEAFVDSEIRPFIQQDGGDIELVDFNQETGIVRVMLHGACSSCPSSVMTLRFGVELRLREAFEEVKGLELAGPLVDPNEA